MDNYMNEVPTRNKFKNSDVTEKLEDNSNIEIKSIGLTHFF